MNERSNSLLVKGGIERKLTFSSDLLATTPVPKNYTFSSASKQKHVDLSWCSSLKWLLDKQRKAMVSPKNVGGEEIEIPQGMKFDKEIG